MVWKLNSLNGEEPQLFSNGNRRNIANKTLQHINSSETLTQPLVHPQNKYMNYISQHYMRRSHKRKRIKSSIKLRLNCIFGPLTI